MKKLQSIVTIIVPTYIHFDNLEKNLRSIANQTYNNIELIITDDGSPNFDKTKIKNMLSKFNQSAHIIVNKDNLGTVRNLNNAIKKSSGDYILFLSQDDIFYNKYTVSKIVNSFSDDDYIVCAKAYYHGQHDFKYSKYIKKSINNPKKIYKYLMLFENPFSGACTYYKRRIFDEYGYFDDSMRLLEDYPFYLYLLRKGVYIKTLDFFSIIYNTNGISGIKGNSTLESDVNIMFKREYHTAIGKRYACFRLCENWIIKLLFFPDFVIYNFFNKLRKHVSF